MALTPEEQKELNELEALEAQSSNLTPEEQIELDELEALEAQSVNNKVSAMDTFKETALQGITFGASDEIEAGIKAAIDIGNKAINDPNLPSWSDLTASYNRYQNEAQDRVENVRAANPTVGFIGDMVGSAAALAVPGAATKLAGTALRAALTGGFSGMMGTRDKFTWKAIVNAAVGATGGAVGQKIGTKVAELSQVRSEILKNKSIYDAVSDIGTVSNKHKLLNKIAARGLTEDDFMSHIHKNILIEAGESTDDVIKKVSLGRRNLYSKIKQIYSEVDKVNPEGVILGPQAKSRLETKLVSEFNFDEKELPKVIKRFIPELDTHLDNQLITLDDFDKLMNRVSSRIISSSDENAVALSRSIREESQSILSESANKIIPSNVKLEFDQNIEELFSLSNLDDLLAISSDATQRNASKYGGDILNLMSSIAGQGVEKLRTPGGAIRVFVSAATLGASEFLLNAGKRVGLGRLALKMQAAPARYTEFTKRMAAAAMEDNADEFVKVLGIADAQAKLEDFPLSRSTDDLIARYSDIRGILQDKDPMLSSELDRMMKTGNTKGIQSFMSNLSRHPESSGLIQSGIGWDGMISTEQDEIEIKKILKHAKINSTQRAQLLRNMNETRIIPNFNEVEREKTITKVAKKYRDDKGKKEQEI